MSLPGAIDNVRVSNATKRLYISKEHRLRVIFFEVRGN